VGLFKLRKNKRYSYSGRFSEQLSSNPNSTASKKIKPKFEDFRTTVGHNNSFRQKFRNAVNDFKKGSEKSVRVRLLIILSIMAFILLLFFII